MLSGQPNSSWILPNNQTSEFCLESLPPLDVPRIFNRPLSHIKECWNILGLAFVKRVDVAKVAWNCSFKPLQFHFLVEYGLNKGSADIIMKCWEMRRRNALLAHRLLTRNRIQISTTSFYLCHSCALVKDMNPFSFVLLGHLGKSFYYEIEKSVNPVVKLQRVQSI